MNEQIIANAVNHSSLAMIVVDGDGKVVVSTPAANRLFQGTEAGLVGRPISCLLAVASLAELAAHIIAPATDAIIRSTTAKDQQGDVVAVSVHIMSWTDPAQGRLYTLIVNDIGAELASEMRSQEDLVLAANAIRGAHIGVFEYVPASQKVTVSDIWRELLEVDKSEDLDVQMEWRSRVHPDDLAAALEPVRLCAEGLCERASCEYRLRSRDGKQWRWMQTDVAVARRDNTGKPVRLVGAQTDISDRKRIENELRISVDRFRSAFDDAPIGKAIVGLDGSWLRVNSALCSLLGYTKDEMLGTNFQTLTHPDDLAADMELAEQLLAGQISSYQLEKRYIRADGSVVWGLLAGVVVSNDTGEPDHFIAQILDITERRRLAELKSEFVATVSHELRTPLTSILGSLMLLTSMVEDEPFSDDAQRLLYIAQQNGDRLRNLVNDILDFEKFSSAQMRLERSYQRVVSLVEDAVMAGLAAADKFGVRYKVQAADRGLTGYVDPQRFRQVMTNLLSNAAKFADEGSLIDVTVDAPADVVRISVGNSGSGIPEAFRDEIFKPFSQAAPASTRKREGTGLGLSISKQIVEQMGGTIGFESAQDGRTTFWFTVPMYGPDR